MAGDVFARETREFCHVRTHLLCAEGAVQAHAERPRMFDRDVERVERLAGERSSTAIGDGRRDHQWNIRAARVELVVNPGDRRLGVQRVEDGFEQKQIDAAIQQPAHLLAIRLSNLRECRCSERGVVDVRRDRERPIGRADRSGDVARTCGRLRRPLVSGFASQGGGLHVQFVDDRLEAEVRLRNRRAPEGVGLNDVRAGVQVGVMDGRDQIGACQDQQVDVVLEQVRVIAEARAREPWPRPACTAGPSCPWRRRASGCVRRARGRESGAEETWC